MLWLGSGIIGGIGLGLGYISPISTLIKWFPDHRGMATGMAIMGFGGGAMVGSPLANRLMLWFASEDATGTFETFIVLALVYLIFMMGGTFAYRLPPENWKPDGFVPPVHKKLITKGNVHVNTAMKTPQFWMLWVVLCMNVTAGIGILGMASPLLQEIFGGKLMGIELSFSTLTIEQKQSIATIAAGFTGLLSLFNIAGRFFWSTLSDKIGRKNTYHIFLALGCLLYWSIPSLGTSGNLFVFVLCFCIILSMYGGGFATIPAYLADLFGTKMVSAIHGRLLTAWSTAGILGPVFVNYIREYQINQGTTLSEVYNDTMYLLGALLIIGLVANLLVKPVDPKYFIKETAVVDQNNLPESAQSTTVKLMTVPFNEKLIIALAWLAVIIPMTWGLSVTIRIAAGLFQF